MARSSTEKGHASGPTRALAVHARASVAAWASTEDVPLYVLRTEPPTNTVVVGSRDELAVTSIDARGRLYVPVAEAEVKVRLPVGDRAARPCPRRTTASRSSSTEPAYGVARGQFAVLYDDDAVVGAGVITAVA